MTGIYNNSKSTESNYQEERQKQQRRNLTFENIQDTNMRSRSIASSERSQFINPMHIQIRNIHIYICREREREREHSFG